MASHMFLCIAFAINQVSSRCMIAASQQNLFVIDVDDFGSPTMEYSFPGPISAMNGVAFDSNNDRIFVGSFLDSFPIYELDMADICDAFSSNSASVPSEFIVNSAARIWGLAYEPDQNKVYGASNFDTAKFTRINPDTDVQTTLTLTGVPAGEIDFLLESFDGSEGLYYLYGLNPPYSWNKISGYRDPSSTASVVIASQFTVTVPGVTGKTGFRAGSWLNENEVLFYTEKNGNLYILNVNTQVVQAVGNLNSIDPNVRGFHVFRDRSCTNLCSQCASGCRLPIEDALSDAATAQAAANSAGTDATQALSDATQALSDAATAQAAANSAGTDATQALTVASAAQATASSGRTDATQALKDAATAQRTADRAMKEIEKLLAESDSDEGVMRALPAEINVDNSKTNDGYNEKHMTIDVNESMIIAVFAIIVFINVWMFVLCNKEV